GSAESLLSYLRRLTQSLTISGQTKGSLPEQRHPGKTTVAFSTALRQWATWVCSCPSINPIASAFSSWCPVACPPGQSVRRRAPLLGEKLRRKLGRRTLAPSRDQLVIAARPFSVKNPEGGPQPNRAVALASDHVAGLLQVARRCHRTA